MDEQALSIFAGIAEGANKTVQNLYNIGIMEAKLKREDELFKLKKRALDTDIKFKEAQYGEDAMELERTLKKAQIKKIEAESEAKKTAIKQAKAEEAQALKFFTTYFPDVIGDITEQGGVTYAPRGSGRLGAIPEVPEGLEAELPWLKYKSPKKPSYTETYREDLRAAAQRLESGQTTYEQEKAELVRKYPTMGWSVDMNLQDIEARGQAKIQQLRDKAIEELKKAKYPVTENNIRAVIEQLREQ